MTHSLNYYNQLKFMNKLHRTELSKIEKMSERGFQAFKKNFSIGCLENITKSEACELLSSMLALNLKLQSDLIAYKKNNPELLSPIIHLSKNDIY